MKGYLLAGCAAASFVAFCGSAAADTAPGKFDIKIGGDASFSAGYVSQNYDSTQGNTAKGDFTNRFRLQVTPQATADNGMQYGAQFRLRAWRSDGMVDMDQAYIFVDGKFGRVEAGVNAGLNSQYGVTAPSGFGTGGVVGDWTDGPTTKDAGGLTWLTEQNTYLAGTFGGEFNSVTNINPSTKIQYFTPRFFPQAEDNTGLMGMVGYTPQNVSVNTGVSRSGRASQSFGVLNGGAAQAGGSLANPGDSFCQYAYFSSTSAQGCAWKDVVETGLRYDGSFNGVTVSGSFGYLHGSAGSSTDNSAGVWNAQTNPWYNTGFYNLSAYQVGLQLGYAGFLVGGSYQNAGKSGYNRNSSIYHQNAAGTASALTPVQNTTDQAAFTAGISYETGPVVVGFNYAHGQDAGDLTLPGKRTADLYSVGATYTLAPGLTTSIEYLRSLTFNQAGFNTGGSADYIASNTFNASSNSHLFLWKNVITF